MDETPIQPLEQPPIQPSVPIKPAFKFPLALLLIVGLAVAGYFASAYYFTLWPFEVSVMPVPTFTPRPSSAVKAEDVSSWKTYSNSQYGFEFKYPIDFYAQTVPGGSVRITTVNKEQLDFEGDKPASIEIRLIFENINDKKSVQKDIVSNYQEKPISVDNRNAQLITGVLNDNVFGWGGTNHGYVFIDNTPFRLEYDPEDKRVNEVFGQILFNFRFIK